MTELDDILPCEAEVGSKHTFQLIDVKVLDLLPPTFESDAVEDIHGQRFMELTKGLRDDSSDKEWQKPTDDNCTVVLIGCTEKGNSICVRVTNFKPCLFYRTSSKEALRKNLAYMLRLKDDSVLGLKDVKAKNLYGWEPNSRDHPTDRREHNYVQVNFPTMKLMRQAIRLNEGKDCNDELRKGVAKQVPPCHEDKVSAETKFTDETNLVPSGWVHVDGSKCQERISYCNIEVSCTMSKLTPLPDKNDIAPLLVAAVDIECISASNAFPDATNRGDIISMIGAVFWRIGTRNEDAVRCLFVVGKCDDIPNSRVYSFDSECEMLSAFRTTMVKYANPDIVATYNGFGFDLEYMWTRAEMLGCAEFCFMDRLIVRSSVATKRELSSSALGSNELFIITMVGRCNLDIFHWIKAREKLESYKLDDVCEHFLGERKVEMDYKELFKLAVGSPDEIARVGVYCIQDCWLLIALILRLQILTANIEMSRVCFTPMEALVTRGQQFKVMNQLIHYGHREGLRDDDNGFYVLNTPEQYSGGPNDSYEGAYVIDAVKGYYDKPIATLDFMSLYPSIIMANNFCCSTLVLDDQYSDIPGVEYETIHVTDTKVYKWAKGMPGLLPIMLDKLLAARKIAKKAMANATNDIEKNVYNSRQLALKISANSIYGFTGAVKLGKYPCLAVADSTTYKAREMLHQTMVWVQELYPCEVVYGDTDSVMIKFDGIDTIKECFALGDEAADVITGKFSEKYKTKRIVLEMEKVYFPYLLMRKKRYAGLMYEKKKNGEIALSYLDAKGIELVRRDNCALAKRVQADVLDALMYKMDRDLACQLVHKHMTSIVANEPPLSDYKMSKARRKTYANDQLPHINVVKKMMARNPGSEPQVGDRVPFILIETLDLKAKACDKAEDPKYIEEHKLKVDRLYYVEHQIVNPICSLLELVVDNPKSLFTDHIRSLTLQRSKQATIWGFLKRASDVVAESGGGKDDAMLANSDSASECDSVKELDSAQVLQQADEQDNADKKADTGQQATWDETPVLQPDKDTDQQTATRRDEQANALIPKEPQAVTLKEPQAVTPKEPQTVTPKEPQTVTPKEPANAPKRGLASFQTTLASSSTCSNALEDSMMTLSTSKFTGPQSKRRKK